MNIHTIGYNVTAAAATGSAAAAMTGDSLTVGQGREGSGVWLIDWWGKSNTTAGYHELMHPSGHDSTRGIRCALRGDEVQRFLARGARERLQSQELLSVNVLANAVAGDIEIGFLQLMYEDRPGVSTRTIGYQECLDRIERLVTVEASITLAATGAWAGAELITAESDLLLANRDYAWLGSNATIQIGAMAIQSPDFGNVRLACPVDSRDVDMSIEYWLTLSRSMNLPLVPVFSSANKGNTWLSGCDDENGAATRVSHNLALLRP